MSSIINLLVTAAGSELAFAVIKAARIIRYPLRLFGCDMAEEVVGKYWCDEFRIVPSARCREEYLTSIIKMIKDFELTAIVPTADAEFDILAQHREELLTSYGCHVLVNPVEEVQRFSDKWNAYRWYQKHHIPTPRTYLVDTEESCEQAFSELRLPMLLKPRVGGGSRHIYKINTLSELKTLLAVVPNPILQEYIYPDEEEYTAGTYRCVNGEIFSIVMNRKLKFGMTNTCTSIIDKPDLNAFCSDVISRTNLIGSNNIQFRLSPTGPLVLEINARFSGTTAIRANCGFNDLEMWLIDALGFKTINKPTIKKLHVMRFMEEMYIDLNVPELK